MAREIALTLGQIAIVDTEDYEQINSHKWCAKSSHGYGFYADRWAVVDGKATHILMHREILGLKPGDGMISDHRNRNTLDNRRENLRICTHEQNMHNRVAQRNSQTGIKGVHKINGRERWRAQIRRNGEKIHLGYFQSPERAYQAYCEAATRDRGEFANVKTEPRP